MCILFLDWRPSGGSRYVLVAASNRDEYFLRPTQPAHFWHDQPTILAGIVVWWNFTAYVTVT